MLNHEDFIKRLEFLFDHYGLSAALFADKIGVQRSSVSHLMSGRNKPSLDFILKIIAAFPEVDLYWILTGKENTTPTPSENTAEKSIESNLKGNVEIEKIIILYSDGTFSDHQPKNKNANF